MDTELEKPKRSHRGWWIAAGVVVLAAAFVALLWLNGQRRLQRKIEELHAKGFPITFEEVEQKRRLPPGTPNAADLYQKAIGAYSTPPWEVSHLLPVFGLEKLPEPNESISEERSAAIEKFLNANRKTLAYLKQATDIPDCVFSVNQGKQTEYDLFMPLSYCSYVLFIEGYQRFEEDDVSGILATIRERFHIGFSLKQFMDPAARRIYDLIIWGNYRLIQQLMNQVPMNETILMEFRNCLRSGARIPTVEEVLRNDLPKLLSYLENPSIISWRFGIPFIEQKVALSNMPECLNRLDQLASICRLDGYERFQGIREVGADLGDMSIFQIMTESYISHLFGYIITDLWTSVLLDLIRSAIAIEQFRLDTNSLPGKMEELVPKYMEKLPIDPFDGKPFLYKRLEKGYMIYTVSQDGTDDGGEEPKDYPFTVRR